MVENEIHDWFFEPADVAFDEGERCVVVPFRRWSYEEARPLRRRWLGGTEWEAPWYRWYLRVGSVRDFTMRDDARIGSADFDTIAYDPHDRVLTIECSIPVTLRVRVERLAVELEETREAIGRARYRTWRDPAFATSYTGEILPLD